MLFKPTHTGRTQRQHSSLIACAACGGMFERAKRTSIVSVLRHKHCIMLQKAKADLSALQK